MGDGARSRRTAECLPQDSSEFRRATGYVPIDSDHGVIVLGATSECPEARYLVAGVSEGQLRLDRLMDGCPGSEKLTDQVWTTHTIELPRNPPANMRQASLAFTEPFRFPVVRSSPDVVPVGLGQGPGLGRMSIGNGWWRGWFLDDEALPRAIANPEAGALPDVPANAAGLAAWLRANGKLASSPPIELTIDGRTAVRFDLAEPLSIAWPEGSPEAGFDEAWASRIYLIPTFDDTILFWLEGDMPGDYDEAEELLRTITFD